MTVKGSYIYLLLILSGIAFFLMELFLGSVQIPFADTFHILLENDHSSESWRIIIMESRLPRAMAAAMAGILLSLGGLIMQTVFRNPLAGPHILGVSAGASLGVAIVVLGLSSLAISAAFITDLIVVSAAFVGAMVVLMILFIISLRVKNILTVLIFGVLLSAISLALVGMLQYLSPESQLKAFLIWTLGSFDGVEIDEALIMVLTGIPFLIGSVFMLKALNLLLAGDDYAMSLGLDVRRSNLILMIMAGAMTASVTAFCGPIGFIGVVVPHFGRMIFRSFDHRKLFIGSLLLGANVMLLADIMAHLPGSDRILPVNSITSLIGIPFLFYILLKRKEISTL